MMRQNSSFHSTTLMLSSQVSNPSHDSLKIISHPFLPFTGPKVLIAGGCSGTTIFKDTEVLDITNGKTIKLPDLPRGKSGVTGGMLGGIPLICGGYDGQQVHNECHQMAKNNISTFNSHLKSKRAFAATTTKGPSLWVTGGGNSSDGYLKSTEVIQRDGTIVAGPDLPVAVKTHTITETKEDEQYMLIGGRSGNNQFEKSTHYHYKTRNGPWLEGPDLNEARCGHTAGLIFDKVNHTQYTVVVGGHNGSHFLRSVEILKEGSNEWTQGKSSNSFCHCVCLF